MAKLDRPTLAGLTLCALPVAAFSAFSQFETGRMAHIPGELAWVMPVATDAAAFVATRVWLDEKYGTGIRRYAALIVIGCVLLSITGAALHLGLSVPEGQTPKLVPNWLPFAVGATPSLVLAALIHLGALIGAAPERHVKTSQATRPRQKAGSQNVGAAEHRPPTSAAPASKPQADLSTETGSGLKVKPASASSVASAPTPEVGKDSVRAQMLAWLDAINGDTNGADLDRRFGTQNYGRGVLRAWKKHHPMASGE